MNDPLVNDRTVDPKVTRRHRLRLAAIGGVAAIAIIGGGVGAVAASASSPGIAVSAVGDSTTTTLAPTSAAAGGTSGSGTAPTSGTVPTGAPTRPAPKPHLGGTVTSSSATGIVIKDREGFTRTIVVSSGTTYADGLTSPVKVGTKIRAEGTVDANGTSLDAVTVGVDNGPPAGGPGGRGPGGDGRGHGGRGPGGPGGDDRPAPTSGAQTAKPTAPSAPTTAPSTSK